MDYTKYFENHDIEFKGPNKRGYLTLKECLYCGRKNKMTVKIEGDYKGSFNCYRCNQKSTNFNLLRSIIEDKPLEFFKKKVKKGSFIPKIELNVDFGSSESIDQKNIQQIKTWTPYNFNKYFTPIDETHTPEVDYLKGRGISLEDAKKMRVHVYRSDSNQFEVLMNRTYFPIITNNNIYGYMGRDITGMAEIKTLNSGGNLTSDHIWNFDNIKNLDHIVLCEGIFDAYSVGLDLAGALLGKSMSRDSIKAYLLSKMKFTSVTIYLDNGAWKDALNIAEIIQYYKPECNIAIASNPPRVLIEEEMRGLFPGEPHSDGSVLVEPDLLKIIKRAAKLFIEKEKENVSVNQLLPFVSQKDVFFKNEKVMTRLKKYLYKFYEAEFDLEMLKKISKLDYPDANDMTRAEIKKILDDASPFIANLKKVYV